MECHHIIDVLGNSSPQKNLCDNMDDSAACMHPHLNCTSLLNTNIWRKKKGYWIYCNPHEQSYLSRRNKICSFGPLKVQRQTQKVDDDTTGVVWTNIAWASCMCYTKKSWRSWTILEIIHAYPFLKLTQQISYFCCRLGEKALRACNDLVRDWSPKSVIWLWIVAFESIKPHMKQ